MQAHGSSVALLCNRLIDGFIERGQCDFMADLAVPLPSTIFLTLLGLSLADLDEFLAAKEGMIRPDGADEAEHQRQLQREPALISAAVEDLLRYDTPVPSVSRIAMEDTVVAVVRYTPASACGCC
jgi:cytochrome P450